jgi:hypothetical protein
MVDYEYLSALVDFGKSSPANLVLLKNRRDDLFQYITLNQGKDLVTVSIPGQHLNWSKTYTAQEEFTAVTQALRMVQGQPLIIRQTTPVMW